MKKKISICPFVVFTFLTNLLQAQTWSNTGLSFPGLVSTMANYNGTLQVGGTFSTPNEIRSMCVYNGSLYSGGMNNGASTNVYKNGVSIGATSGANNLVFAMTVYNNQLYVTGSFTSINGITANNIARWNGSVWTSVGTGVGVAGDYMAAMCVYNNNLYAGGQSGICYKWDGVNWSTVGTFFTNGTAAGYIRSMCVFNSALYVGGTFDAPALNLAVYNGTSWFSGGDFGVAGMGEGVSAIVEYNGELYCGGHFLIAGGNAANYIARGDGFNWQAMGTGTDGTVTCLLVYNQSLYVGGAFSHAGGVSVGNIAKWAPACTPPTATITYTGIPHVCNPGGSLLLTANAGTGLTYQWRLGNNNIAGATSSTYIVTGAGVYTVIVTNAGGCSATSSYVLVTASNFGVNVSPAGPITICSGGSALLTANAANGLSFQWKKNGAIIAGATASTYTATTSGNYTVDATNGPCTKTSTAVVVNTGSLTAAITPPGVVVICSGSSTTLSASAGTGYSYQWYRNNIVLSSGISPAFTTSTGGTYKCIITSGTCTSTTNSVVVSVINNPTPTITASGPITFCAGQSVIFTANTFAGVTYQWQKNSVNIAGATNQTYTATTGGTYRANEMANGCSKFTPKKAVTVNCRMAGETNDDINTQTQTVIEVFPNPFAEKLKIKITSPIADQTEIKVTDVLGKEQYKQIITTNTTQELDIELAAGIYMVTALIDGELKVLRIVKSR